MKQLSTSLLMLVLLTACGTEATPAGDLALSSAPAPPYYFSGSAYSLNPGVLFDKATGTADEASWEHGGNQWDADQYPMYVEIDLADVPKPGDPDFRGFGGTGGPGSDLDPDPNENIEFTYDRPAELEFYVGNMPFVKTASLRVYVRDSVAEAWDLVGSAPGGEWNTWGTAPLERMGRYVRLEFAGRESFFNVYEIDFLVGYVDIGGTSNSNKVRLLP